MFLAFTEGLGIDYNLVFFIDCGDTVITLDCAFAGFYFAGFVVAKLLKVLLFTSFGRLPWPMRAVAADKTR